MSHIDIITHRLNLRELERCRQSLAQQQNPELLRQSALDLLDDRIKQIRHEIIREGKRV